MRVRAYSAQWVSRLQRAIAGIARAASGGLVRLSHGLISHCHHGSICLCCSLRLITRGNLVVKTPKNDNLCSFAYITYREGGMVGM